LTLEKDKPIVYAVFTTPLMHQVC